MNNLLESIRIFYRNVSGAGDMRNLHHCFFSLNLTWNRVITDLGISCFPNHVAVIKKQGSCCIYARVKENACPCNLLWHAEPEYHRINTVTAKIHQGTAGTFRKKTVAHDSFFQIVILGRILIKMKIYSSNLAKLLKVIADFRKFRCKSRTHGL